MARLFPSTSSQANVPTQGNPNGDRVFRVTDRNIDQRTRLVIANDWHHARYSVIPLDALPESVWEFAADHGLTDRLERIYA